MFFRVWDHRIRRMRRSSVLTAPPRPRISTGLWPDLWSSGVRRRRTWRMQTTRVNNLTKRIQAHFRPNKLFYKLERPGFLQIFPRDRWCGDFWGRGGAARPGLIFHHGQLSGAAAEADAGTLVTESELQQPGEAHSRGVNGHLNTHYYPTRMLWPDQEYWDPRVERWQKIYNFVSILMLRLDFTIKCK